MNRARQALWILLLALSGMAVWSLLHPWLPKAGLAETNFQANLIRLQSWALEPARTNVILGSSIGGRLLPGDFAGTPLSSMASLALDGSGPELGVRLALVRSNPPTRVFVEVHRLGKPWMANDDTLLAALREPGFALADKVPGFRADTRPTTLLYSWLKGVQKPARRAPLAGRPSADPRPSPTGSGWEAGFAAQAAELQRRGSEVILLRLPVGRENPANPEAQNEADQLAHRLGLRLIDLNRAARRRGLELSYTDGLHLAPGSARQLCALLAELAGPPSP